MEARSLRKEHHREAAASMSVGPNFSASSRRSSAWATWGSNMRSYLQRTVEWMPSVAVCISHAMRELLLMLLHSLMGSATPAAWVQSSSWPVCLPVCLCVSLSSALIYMLARQTRRRPDGAATISPNHPSCGLAGAAAGPVRCLPAISCSCYHRPSPCLPAITCSCCHALSL